MRAQHRPICSLQKSFAKTTTVCDLCLFLHQMCCKMVPKFCEIWIFHGTKVRFYLTMWDMACKHTVFPVLLLERTESKQHKNCKQTSTHRKGTINISQARLERVKYSKRCFNNYKKPSCLKCFKNNYQMPKMSSYIQKIQSCFQSIFASDQMSNLFCEDL